MRFQRIAVLLIIATAVLLVGCGGAPEEAALGLVVADGERVTAPSREKAAPDFRLATLDGDVAQLSDFLGQPVMVNFWASWCGPCQAEIPNMVAAYGEGDQGFEIVAVNIRETEEKVQKFVDSTGIQFPVLLDTDASVASGYVVRGIPTSFFLDSEGVVVAIHEGTLTAAQLQGYIDLIVE